MKKVSAVLWSAVLALLLCSCVRTGERDSVDFLSSMIKAGYDCTVEETVSAEYLKESCYVNGCRLSLFSESGGKLARVILTCVPDSRGIFSVLAADTIKAFCSYTEENVADILKTLGIGEYLPDDSGGVRQCTTQWYSFSFTCDEAGGALEITSLRLEPASAPGVTLNTTVPYVTLSEKSAS